MKKVLFPILALVLAVGLALPMAAAPVSASNGSYTLYGTIGGQYLVTIDELTGDATEVATFSGTQDSVGAIAFDWNSGTLYGLARTGGTNRPHLATIDVCTGDVTLVGQITLSGHTVYFAEGLTVDPSGTIYVSMSIDGDISDGDYYSETLATVDSTTAVATSRGPIAPTIQTEADGLEFVGSTLYAADSHGSANPAQIYTLDTSTGAATHKGTLSSPAFHNVSDMAYNPDPGNPAARLLYGSDPGAVTLGTPRNLCTISQPGEATATAIGITHTAAEFDGGLLSGLAWASVVCAEPAINIEKRANRTRAHEGDGIIYTYRVTNTGNVPLSSIVVTDPDVHRGPAYFSGDDGDDGILETTETWIYHASYWVPYFCADTTVTNTGHVSGMYETEEVTDSSDEVVVHIVHNPAIDVEKWTDEDAYFNGTEVTYYYEVTNTGDCSLDVTLMDSVLGEITDPTGDGGLTAYLDPGDIWTYTAEDILECPPDNYEYSLHSNVATATGVDATSGEATDCDCWTLIIFQWQPRTIGYWGNWDNHYEVSEIDALVDAVVAHGGNLQWLIVTHLEWDNTDVEQYGNDLHDFLLGKPPKLTGTHKAMFLMEKQFVAAAFNVWSYQDWVSDAISGFTGTADAAMDPNATVYLSGTAAGVFDSETTVIEILHQIAAEKLAWYGDDDVSSIKAAQKVLDMMNNAENNNYELFVHPDFDPEVCLLTGNWAMSYIQLSPTPGPYDHNMSIDTQNMDGSFSGTGNYPAGIWTWNVTGTVTDSTVSMTISYNEMTYTVSLSGIVAECGTSMSGTATDSWGNSYTWTGTRV